MTLNDFQSSIRLAKQFFEAQKLLLSTIYLCALPRSVEFNKFNLTTTDYTSIYEKGLSLSHYNFILKDYSYFQFSYDSPTEYALAYYPNPKLSGSAELAEHYAELEREKDDGLISEEDFADLISDFPSHIAIPRIRFEYSERQYINVRHPGAHFHIGMSGQDRWPSARKLSPKTFSLLLAKFYYPDDWWPNSRFSRSPGEQNLYLSDCLDEKLLTSIRTDGVSQFFSADEKLSFHFAALQGPIS